MSQFLSVRGRKIFKGSDEVRLRGVNFGNWMLIEHFMIGLPWTEYKIREHFRIILGEEKCRAFFDAYMNSYITEDDFRFLAEAGLNFVRLPFNYRHFEDDNAPGIYKEEGFAFIDRLLPLCRKYGIYLMLDLHAAPGAQAPDWNAESAYGEAFFWEQKSCRDRAVALNRAVARRYADEEMVMGYDILNEPVTSRIDLLNDYSRDAIAAIREVDKNHIIVIESNNWGRDIESLQTCLFADPQVIPSFHHYNFQFHPFGEIAVYPGAHEGKHYGREELLSHLGPRVDTDRIPRPHVAGEFGFWMGGNTPLEAHCAMLDDLLGWFEEQDFPWTLWTYKDVGFMGMVWPKESTPWQKFLKGDTIKAIRSAFRSSTREFSKRVIELLPPEEDQKKIALRQNVTGTLRREVERDYHAASLQLILTELKEYPIPALEEMARSFAFVNCDVNLGVLAVLKKHAATLR